jgi:hypothetical protein
LWPSRQLWEVQVTCNAGQELAHLAQPDYIHVMALLSLHKQK